MYVLKLTTDYSAIELAMSFYTYVLHTRVDINLEDIYFVYQENKKLYRVVLNCLQDKTFGDIMGNSEIVEITDINNLQGDNPFVCVYVDNEEYQEENYKDAQIVINRTGTKYYFELQREFSYNQKTNFEKYFIRLVNNIKEKYEQKLEEISI